ncbi:MAG: T9SS type A sorting domain-containing protein [candidate division Zixibacteria bacterium]|nr:T9SS type A sorting domain-containing protein [candidate division Zixibacteria bacterium]
MSKKAIALCLLTALMMIPIVADSYAQPPASIEIIPENPPIIIRSWYGGWFHFHGQIINNTDHSLRFQQWVRIIFPVGLVYEPIWENSHILSLPAHDTLICIHLAQHVPGCVEEGDYLYTHFVGEFDFQNPANSVRWDSSSFYYTMDYDFEGSPEDCVSWFELQGCFPDGSNMPVPSHELDQNYPNPFNAQTQINYDLSYPSDIKVEIYDILGRLVRTLESGAKTAGPHTILWDGKNESGQSVAAGIYFYRLTGPDFAVTKRMTLLK